MATTPQTQTGAAASDLLATPEVRRMVHRVSVERYQQLGLQGLVGEKTELIRGVIVDKMTKSPDHSWLSEFLAEWFRERLPEEWLVRHEQPLTLADSEPEPDIAVVAGRRDDFRKQHPGTAELVIEVAVSSEKLDREKASVYAEAGVAEYWIVLAEQDAVQVYQDVVDGRHTKTQTVRVGDTLRPQAFAGLALPVAELFPPTA